MPKSPVWSQEKYLKAFHFAAQAHRGQKYCGTGLPYIMHVSFVCMETIAALEVENVNHPDLAVQCALLHDVIEDTKMEKNKLEEEFGEEIAKNVLYLTKDREIKDKEKQFTEYIFRLTNAPKEVKLVKLADRISNLQKPPFHWNAEKKRDYLEESKVILKMLGNASPYLSKRLQEKIDNYQKFIK